MDQVGLLKEARHYPQFREEAKAAEAEAPSLTGTTGPRPHQELARPGTVLQVSFWYVGGRGRRISAPGQPGLHSKVQENQEEYAQFAKDISKTKQPSPPPKKNQQ